MPATLRPEAEADWLNLDTNPEQALELLAPYPDEEMRAYEVSIVVNSPAHDTLESNQASNVITLLAYGFRDRFIIPHFSLFVELYLPKKDRILL